jgi:hypothetical protein
MLSCMVLKSVFQRQRGPLHTILALSVTAYCLQPSVAVGTEVSIVVERIDSAFTTPFTRSVVYESVKLLPVDKQTVFVFIFNNVHH